MTIWLTTYRIGVFSIDDVIFNIPTTQELGRLKESPSVVGKLIPLGQLPN